MVLVVNIVLTLKKSHGQLQNSHASTTDDCEQEEINLLSRSKRLISKTKTASGVDRTPEIKRPSRLAKDFSAVNIPVPYPKVHLRPIHVARTFAYSKKPDVYIEHVHVHNGGRPRGFINCREDFVILVYMHDIVDLVARAIASCLPRFHVGPGLLS